ncbi:major facilitator superfamily MFS-1 [Xylariomycetidae sp. FL2044]|nr:major facilitator superfamily MFS-1 [Xylariomycetidae sp. FL2044]
MAADQDSEKAAAAFDRLEEKGTNPGSVSDEYDAHEAKKILWRIDRRLVVTVGAMYCVSLMDRTNLSAAAVAGMNAELKLDIGSRYSVATLIFFVPYIIFQPPSTVLVRRIGPRIHLSLITAAWGLVMLGMGFVKTYESLAGLRVVLGVFEAGFFPSCVYLLSTWYTRYEVGRRYSFFYVIGCVASAFSGILAFGLTHLHGRGGLSGWRWIFIVEGILTTVLGVAGYWLLVDFPDSDRKTWRFLNDSQRQWIVRRVDADRGDAKVTKFELSKFLGIAKDLKVWAFALIAFATTTISYAIAFFLPIILNRNLGFDAGTSQCLVAPPYAFAGLYMYGMGWVGDRCRLRGPIMLANMTMCLIGLPILGWHPHAGVRYLGAFFLTAGANANVPHSLAYQANNIRGQWKRAFASATWVGFGGIGGIAGSLVFREEDAATGYKPGLYACIACSLMIIVIVCLCDLFFYIENRRADRGEKELEATEEDYQPGFRYTY